MFSLFQFIVVVTLLISIATASEYILPPKQVNTTFAIHPQAVALTSGDIRFYFTNCEKTVQPLELKCQIYVQNFHKNQTLTNERKYNLTLTGSDNSKGNKDLKFLSITAVDFGDIIFRWLEIEDNIVENARYDVLSSDESLHKSETFPIGLSENDPAFLNDFYTSPYFNFEVYVSSGIACRGDEKCVIDMARQDGRRKGNAFKLNLANARIYGSDFGISKKNYYYTEGFDPITGMYKLMYVVIGDQTLIELKSLDASTNYVSESHIHGFANCHVGERSSTTSKVSCMTNVRGEMLINSRFDIQDQVKLIKIWFTLRPDQSMLVVSEKDNCIGDDCWNLFVTMVYESKPAVTRQIKFNCTGDRKNLAIVVYEKTDELVYGCEKVRHGSEGTTRYFQAAKVVL